MENAGIPDAQTIIVAIKLVVVLALLCFLCSASLFLVRKESSAHSLFLFFAFHGSVVAGFYYLFQLRACTWHIFTLYFYINYGVLIPCDSFM